MKVGNSKLFRKLHLNRKSTRICDMIANKPKCDIPPVENWWKARNVKDTV